MSAGAENNSNEPYKGLIPYEEDNKNIFFGRENEREILIHKIVSEKLTLLFAATGVGKSSLLQAAVMPELKRSERENLDVVNYRDWVSEPKATLKNTVLKTLKDRGKLDDDFNMDAGLPLNEFFEICATFSSDPLVVILDQFEEFFQYRRYADGFQDFVRELSESLNDRQTRVAFVISMREDFALELNAFKDHLAGTARQYGTRQQESEQRSRR